MSSRRSAPFFTVLLFFFTRLTAQSPLLDALAPYGGQAGVKALARYGVSGQLTDHRGAGKPFRLFVDGDSMRFEWDGRVMVRDATHGQWWHPGKPRSSIEPNAMGLAEVFITPLFALGKLAANYKWEGNADGLSHFSSKMRLRKFLGYDAAGAEIRLGFDRETGLLAQARFEAEDGSAAPVAVKYRNYALFEDIPLPQRIERKVGSGILWVFEVTSVALDPPPSGSEFDFIPGGTGR